MATCRKRRKQIKIDRRQHRRLAAFMLVSTAAALYLSCSVQMYSPSTETKGEGGAVGVAATGERGVGELELPLITDDEFVIRNEAGRYTMLYDTAHRQAAWVAYLLTREDMSAAGAKRKDNFRVDPHVRERGWPYAANKDYKASGYDRGHLLPSADRISSQESNAATFLLSNMSPQHPALNRGVWRRLEEQVRLWAERYDSLYVVTGSELHGELRCIGSGVGVPENYFKGILARSADGRYFAVGFMVPNVPQTTSSFMDYCITINELEQKLGYDLFPGLPDSIEEAVEAAIESSFW